MPLRHPLDFFRPRDDDDQPRTVTYYAPRRRPVDPREVPADDQDQDVRQVVGGQLPAGFDWAPRPPLLTLIDGGDPTAPGLDEIEAGHRVRAAIARWGVSAA
ncbi:hypothetical protein [Streptomyces sp. NPDC049879]|uniref:hypothetical protein n=1 Tax=Streptomyces sp. NPDC049879 TaxID=3365598 RepID=UPI0037936FE4